MYQPRTDIALEAHETAIKNNGNKLDGIICREEITMGFSMTKVEIKSEEASRITSKPRGKYLTLHTGELWNEPSENLIRASKALSTLIRRLSENFIKEESTVLVVGLGNVTITADAIGPKALEHIIVSRHIKESAPEVFKGLGLIDISAIAPGVLSQTGIETEEIIKSVVDRIRPSVVVAIDSLASRNLDRLVKTIQLSDTGITPGSGIGNHRNALNRETLGVPVISIGIPTVVDADALAYDILEKYSKNDVTIKSLLEKCFNNNEESLKYFVTPKDTDLIISSLSKVIGYGINLAFHKNINYEEMVSLAN